MNDNSTRSSDGISIFRSDNPRTKNKAVAIVFGVFGIILAAQLVAALKQPTPNGPVLLIVTAIFSCIIFVIFYRHRITTLLVLRATQRTLTIESTSHFGRKKNLVIDLAHLSFNLQTVPRPLRSSKTARLYFYLNNKKVHFIESRVDGWTNETLRKIVSKLHELGVRQTLKQ